MPGAKKYYTVLSGPFRGIYHDWYVGHRSYAHLTILRRNRLEPLKEQENLICRKHNTWWEAVDHLGNDNSMAALLDAMHNFNVNEPVRAATPIPSSSPSTTRSAQTAPSTSGNSSNFHTPAASPPATPARPRGSRPARGWPFLAVKNGDRVGIFSDE